MMLMRCMKGFRASEHLLINQCCIYYISRRIKCTWKKQKIQIVIYCYSSMQYWLDWWNCWNCSLLGLRHHRQLHVTVIRSDQQRQVEFFFYVVWIMTERKCAYICPHTTIHINIHTDRQFRLTDCLTHVIDLCKEARVPRAFEALFCLSCGPILKTEWNSPRYLSCCFL